MVSGTAFLRRLRDCLAASGMSADKLKDIHCRSLRAGGCTDYFACGESRERICMQGGWSLHRGAVDKYNRPTPRSRATSMHHIARLLTHGLALPVRPGG